MLFNVRGNQGQGWNLAEVTVPTAQQAHDHWFSQAQFHIRVIRGSGTQGDIAIDDISSTPGACAYSSE
jgi:hypothetical protein